ncbi:hypothetical protein HDU76_003127 [Blyttiomyces sp. JEL0837]|nr:hypothetical protein HDU76_003127 [Blyttiomyces sp. JEL0837]
MTMDLTNGNMIDKTRVITQIVTQTGLPNTPTDVMPDPNGKTMNNTSGIDKKTIAVIGVACFLGILMPTLIGLIIAIRKRRNDNSNKVKTVEVVEPRDDLVVENVVQHEEFAVSVSVPTPESITIEEPEYSFGGNIDVIERHLETDNDLFTDLHPSVQRSLYEKARNGNGVAGGNAGVVAPLPVPRAVPVERQNRDQSGIVEGNEVRSTHRGIELEIHLQRTYGLYTTWSHHLVLDWARVKKVDKVIFNILRDYYVDGELLSTLDVHSLKSKLNIQDFRIRAKFIQCVEFLKDSHNVLVAAGGPSQQGQDGDDTYLPEYSGRSTQD